MLERISSGYTTKFGRVGYVNLMDDQGLFKEHEGDAKEHEGLPRIMREMPRMLEGWPTVVP